MNSTDPVVNKFSVAIRELFGNRIERMILFGSRARGDATNESDYDIALFLHALTDRWLEGDRIADVELQLLDDTGAFVETLIYPAGHWRHASSPLMHEIRKNGLDV